MAPVFSANNALLNPKFDGYKLKILEQKDCVQSFQLPSPGVTQSTVSGRRIIPFTEVSARIKHNHLKLGNNGLLYVDQSGGVVSVEFDGNFAPTFRNIFEIPQEVSSIKSDLTEYPVALEISSDRMLVSDGSGRLYLSGTEEVYELTDKSGTLIPCRLLHTRQTETGLEVLITRRGPIPDAASKDAQTYELVALRLSSGTLREIWSLLGTSLPADIQYDHASEEYIISSPSPFRPSTAPEVLEPTPTKDEMAPIPRAGENLDTASTTNDQTTPIPPPHAYSWTQTEDSVTVMFPLPSSTPKSAIRVTLSKSYLTLHIISSSASSIPLPKYAQCPWWAEIDSGASLWTWEHTPDERESKVGLLTLHLEKKHTETRWSHVFSQSSNEPEVPETLDPSELANIREALEKYTSEMAGDMPSLANPDADEELDAPGQVGQRVLVMRVGAQTGKVEVDQREVSLLSSPVSSPKSGPPSLVVRRDIDGLLFTRSTSHWEHESTYSALSFVLASKRDTRFVLHHKDKMVLAFESGSTHGTGNVYVYRGHGKAKSQFSEQSVLGIADKESGSLLGVVMLKEGVFCCLCERRLIVLKGIV
ncbi:CS domain-containing protein [Rhizoctonia solani]|uniref:NudC domain-containing protein 1 n=1 Tax=Rhizoctonia solani TaxID=456999 RepID=A0A8H7HGV1_9AGAM|nr:CS domain-containing protein [Rhizoctonia solani]KAF8685761.1 CS domain [Rhizoctonia solani]QRW20091.1 CS domain-containing protein [Rhizoctonia solani]